jgi:glycine/D-amino acid oxidase-like deaminating enzyme
MEPTSTARRAPTFPAAAPPSWWQLRAPSAGHAPIERDSRADVVVVGGGVTGCSVAHALTRAGARVILLEARDIASGASGRNGGFLLAGMAHRPVALASLVGERRAAELYEFTAEGRDRLLETAEAIGAGAHVARTGSLRLAVDLTELDELHAEATLLESMGSVRVQRLDAHELPPRLLGHFRGGLLFPDDGRSMPAGWVRALAASAAEHGAVIHEHSPVVAVDDDAEGVVVRTAGDHEVRADHVVLATEAWLPGIAPELAGVVLPYRSQVLAASAPRDGRGEVERVLPQVTWSRRGWDYAQQAEDGTLIVGGERLEDVELLRHWEESVVEDDQAWLKSWVQRVLGTTPHVEARWAGVLSQTTDGFPLLGPLPGRPRVMCCGGWGGAGNVLGFVGGRLVADLVLGLGDAIPQELRTERLAAG